MKVLAKPELENHIILNEFVLIMENFGVPDNLDDDEEDDFIPDTDSEDARKRKEEDQEPEPSKIEDQEDKPIDKTPVKKDSKSKICDKNKID